MNYKELRKKFKVFSFDSYKWEFNGDNLIAYFVYKASNKYIFNHRLVINKVPQKGFKSNDIDNLVFNIGMSEIFNYWKAFCSPIININCGFLDDFQTRWWEKLLLKGMGQYFFENKINFLDENFVKIRSVTKTRTDKKFNQIKTNGKGVLIPIGGGKDSSLTLELLKNSDSLGMMVNYNQASVDTAKVAETDFVLVERILDKKILELNSLGFLNGHVPFSAVLSFTSVLVAYLFNKRYIAFSNEKSSDEGNLKYLGIEINHQYSKTFEFENDFRIYNKKYLTDIDYFSFLRPLYDLQIAKSLSMYPKYVDKLVSCNSRNNKNQWCGKCPKCLSTFILFNTFIPSKITKVFGKNLVLDPNLQDLLDLLINENKQKPFECVGTKLELRIALTKTNLDNIINSWGENNLPPCFKMLLYFNVFLKNKKILILGYGKEGQSTEKTLKKLLPNQKYSIADQTRSKSYLSNLGRYEVIFKSPGIPNKLIQIKKSKIAGVNFTSQTKIFLKLFRDQIIGITGTKGKSTTTSLIHHILKSNMIKCELVGNIGRPIFDYLNDDENDKIYVAEFSSHQLSDVDVSPHWAVFLNIYPEHLDYYESYKDYKKAKENINRFQQKGDISITPKEIDNLKLIKVKTKLLGSHNDKNIKAAFLVAKSFGLTSEQILKSVSTFNPLVDRLEVVRVVNGVAFINDGLATIPQASLAAVDSFSDINITLILGGYDRGIDFTQFGKELALRKNVKNIILIGQTAIKIEQSLKPFFEGHIYNLGFSKMSDIVTKAYQVTQSNGIVLLSPSATSFDMFKDYKDRDDQFKKAVNNI